MTMIVSTPDHKVLYAMTMIVSTPDHKALML